MALSERPSLIRKQVLLELGVGVQSMRSYGRPHPIKEGFLSPSTFNLKSGHTPNEPYTVAFH